MTAVLGVLSVVTFVLMAWKFSNWIAKSAWEDQNKEIAAEFRKKCKIVMAV